MSGPILDDYRRVELRGEAPRVDNNCRISGYDNNLLAFQLIEPSVVRTSTPPPAGSASALPRPPITPAQPQSQTSSQSGENLYYLSGKEYGPEQYCKWGGGIPQAYVEVCKKLKPHSLQAAQQKDPYVDSYRQQQSEREKQKRNEFLSAVERFGFASACKIFRTAEGMHVVALAFARSSSLYMEGSQFLRIIQNAKAAGLAQAARPGGCDYWHQHPEEVYQLRQLEWTAYPR